MSYYLKKKKKKKKKKDLNQPTGGVAHSCIWHASTPQQSCKRNIFRRGKSLFPIFSQSLALSFLPTLPNFSLYRILVHPISLCLSVIFFSDNFHLCLIYFSYCLLFLSLSSPCFISFPLLSSPLLSSPLLSSPLLSSPLSSPLLSSPLLSSPLLSSPLLSSPLFFSFLHFLPLTVECKSSITLLKSMLQWMTWLGNCKILKFMFLDMCYLSLLTPV